MELYDLLKKVDYKLVEQEGNIKIIKIAKRVQLFYMESKNNQFEMERDYYEYLDGHSMPYVLLLFDLSAKRYYYIAFNKSNNWIKSCFDSCEKDKLYLGKQVLNCRITEDELVIKLSKL